MKYFNKKRGNLWITIELDNEDIKNGIKQFIEYATSIIEKIDKKEIDKEYKIVLLEKLIPPINDFLDDIAEFKANNTVTEIKQQKQ
jgi:ACT domain-containing protein